MPVASDDVIIDVRGPTITVTYSSGISLINSLTLNENLNITAGTLNLNSDSVVNGTLTLSGSLGGAGNLTINGGFTWTASNNDFPIGGAGILTVAPSAVFTKTGTGRLERRFVNQGTVNSPTGWICSTGVIFDNGAAFNCPINSGTAIFNSGNAPNVVFNNNGTITKTGTGGMLVFGTLNNAGIVDAQAGDFGLRGGTQTGPFLMGSSAGTLYCETGPITFSATSSVIGSGSMYVRDNGLPQAIVVNCPIDLQGSLLINQGVHTFNGPVAVRGTLSLGEGCCSNAITTFNGAVDLLPNGVIATIGNCTANFSGPSMDLAGSAVSNCTLTFANEVSVTRSFTWNNATILGPGAMVIAPSGSVNLLNVGANGLQIEVENNGTLNLNSGFVSIRDTGHIENNSLMLLSVGSGMSTVTGSSVNLTIPSITNNGTFNKGGSGTVEFGGAGVPLTFANNGDLNVTQGRVAFKQLFSNSGELVVSAGAAAEIDGPSVHDPLSVLTIQGALDFLGTAVSTHDLLGQTLISGSLFIRFAIVNLFDAITPTFPIRVSQFGTLRTDVDQSWPMGLDLSGSPGATLDGAGNILLGGASVFRGTMTGTGTITIAANATLTTNSPNGGDQPRLARTLENLGTFTVSNVGVLEFDNGILNNHGTLILSANGLSLRGISGVNAFVNSGTLDKNLNTTNTFANLGAPLALTNSGTVNVNQGSLQLDCGSSGIGEIIVDPNATLRVNSNCAAGSVSNNGTVWLAPQKHLTLSGAYSQSATGKLQATVITPLSPLVSSAGSMTIAGAVDLLMTPLPPTATTVQVLHSAASSITGDFSTRVLKPQGIMQHDADSIDWVAYRFADANGDNVIDVNDLLAVVNTWGACPTPPTDCAADFNSDGVVNVVDLLAVINNWGL